MTSQFEICNAYSRSMEEISRPVADIIFPSNVESTTLLSAVSKSLPFCNDSMTMFHCRTCSESSGSGTTFTDSSSFSDGIPNRVSSAQDMPVPKNTNGLSAKNSRIEVIAISSVSKGNGEACKLTIVPPGDACAPGSARPVIDLAPFLILLYCPR